MNVAKLTAFLVLLSVFGSCSTTTTRSGPQITIKTREQTSVPELIQMFGPAVKHYKVPGHEKYEVVFFRPLFPNWRERVFLYKDGRYFDQASGEYPVEVRVTKDDEVCIVKTGPSMGRPVGSPRPRGGY